MILLVEPVIDAVADAIARAGRHGWTYRSCTVDDAVVADDDAILLHTVDIATTAEIHRLRSAVAPTIAVASASWIATTDWSGEGYVAAVDRNQLAAALPGLVAEWSHAARLATIDRLSETFGAVPVAGLLRGLRGAVENVLVTDDPARLAAEAHRIAGLAGTLGFAALGRHWLRVAEAGDRPSPATRRATAHALATLDRAERRAAFTIS
ncbi:hypothetical protein [Sphingomonas sp. 8AM]|uniref:hypothetical protein n=1 Tax=Sphingomonas sp. 8AM TaxID=2653170 RepID=UPI0012F157F8|nr:hypothetical protein [Sphingomonas sp. 8AM]VXC33427.1 conserved hypothetical protein [Sphingomonas sp. 8AM]